MALYARLIGIERPKIPAHQFCAAVAERVRGRITSLQLSTMLQLSSEEQQELLTLYNAVVAAGMSSKEVEDIIELAEIGWIYTTEAEMKARFGVT